MKYPIKIMQDPYYKYDKSDLNPFNDKNNTPPYTALFSIGKRNFLLYAGVVDGLNTVGLEYFTGLQDDPGAEYKATYRFKEDAINIAGFIAETLNSWYLGNDEEFSEEKFLNYFTVFKKTEA